MLHICEIRSDPTQYRTIGTYAVLQVGTVPNMQSIHNVLTIIGHRFGHRSGVYQSSGRNPTIFLYGIAFRVYLVISKIREKYCKSTSITNNNIHFSKTNVVFQQNEKRLWQA